MNSEDSEMKKREGLSDGDRFAVSGGGGSESSLSLPSPGPTAGGARVMLDSGYSTGPDTTPGVSGRIFYLPGEDDAFEPAAEIVEEPEDLTGEPDDCPGDCVEDCTGTEPAGSPRGAASRPISIPRRARAPRPPELSHPDHTPPRGYMSPSMPGNRYSTGSLGYTAGGSPIRRTISTQTSVSLRVEQMIQQSIEVQEQALRLNELALREFRSSGVSRARTCSESLSAEEEEVAPRSRAVSDPSALRQHMQRLHLERMVGQELRRISDQFDQQRFGALSLFRIPEDTTGRPSSFPGTETHHEGWWQRIVQFMSPGQVRRRARRAREVPPGLQEPDTGEITS